MKGKATDHSAESSPAPAGGDEGHGACKSAHRPQFIAARDSRNRRISSLCVRNGRYYAIPWADRGDGTKAARRFPLFDESGAPIRGPQAAHDALDSVKARRADGALPPSGIKPPFDDFAASYLEMQSTRAKKQGTQQNEAQAIARWKIHFGRTRIDRLTTPAIKAFIESRMRGCVLAGRKYEPVSPRTAKLDLIALSNVLHAAAVEMNEHISPVMTEILARLRTTNFKDGLRGITKADLHDDDAAKLELDFTIIKTQQEAVQAVRYEYMREVEAAYLAVKDALNLRGQRHEGSQASERTANTPPAKPLLARIEDRLLEYFPLPYASIPETVPAQMRTRKKGDCLTELDETEFRHWEKTYQSYPPEHRLILSFHRLAINWTGRGIKAVKQAVSQWIAKHAPKNARLQKRDELTKRPNDALSQHCAWRAIRAGNSHSVYKERLFQRLEMPSRSRGLKYADTSAYQKAAAGAEKRARILT